MESDASHNVGLRLPSYTVQNFRDARLHVNLAPMIAH